MEDKNVKINLSTLIFIGIVIGLIIIGLISYILAMTNEGQKLNENIEVNEEKELPIANINEEINNKDIANISNEEQIDENKEYEEQIDKNIEYEEWNSQKLKNNIVYAFDEVDIVGEKYVQFENNLFSIYDASLGILNLESINSLIDSNKEITHKKIFYDLNNDSENEEIIIETLEDGYSFKENGREFFKTGIDSYINIYIVDLNESDEKIEIIIRENDTNTIFVRSDVQMRATLKDITGYILTDKDGIICVGDLITSRISPVIFLEYYITENGLITLKKCNLEDFKDSLFYTDDSIYTGVYFTTDLEGMKAQAYDAIPNDINFEYDGKYVRKIDENTKFYITGIIKSDGDSKHDLKVKLLDGTEGYIYHKDGYLNVYKP